MAKKPVFQMIELPHPLHDSLEQEAHARRGRKRILSFLIVEILEKHVRESRKAKRRTHGRTRLLDP